jgi:hypothetical protein
VQGATVGNPIEVKGGAFPIVFLPISFGGGQLSATFTIISSTFASLGVTPGSYVYTLLGSNDTMTVQFGVNPIPIPAALPLFATGVATVAYAGRRRKKAGAAQAAA